MNDLRSVIAEQAPQVRVLRIRRGRFALRQTTFVDYEFRGKTYEWMGDSAEDLAKYIDDLVQYVRDLGRENSEK